MNNINENIISSEMKYIKNYRDLIVWQKSMDLNLMIYNCTKSFPKEELFGLTSQMRRAAVSMSANIAEGHLRNSKGEFHHFLGIAKGSLAELETFLILSEKLKFITDEISDNLMKLSKGISKMLHALQKSIKNKSQIPNP
jgi:four helix bundle protein